MFRTLALIAVLASPVHTIAQDTAPAKFFRLDFLVKEMEGSKTVNSRAYSTLVSTDTTPFVKASIRTGSKVPVQNTAGQFTYVEVGVNIDCERVKLEDQQLSLSVTAEISSVLQEPPPNSGPGIVQPTIRQNKWSSPVLIPLRKSTILFSADDLTTKRQMQLEVTATPVK